ncbi:hypothetical protein [Methylobacterium sp. sgz302541]|uniref:hypothetical protein n=1 Tax=unclassified Methylobacterium TaxID=2615210 RepID=UPI003D33CFF4
MRTPILAAAAVISLLGVQGAFAETTVIHRDAPDTVVVDRPATTSSTTVEKHEHADGCRSKTVTRTNDEGDRKTVTKESCD